MDTFLCLLMKTVAFILVAFAGLSFQASFREMARGLFSGPSYYLTNGMINVGLSCVCFVLGALLWNFANKFKANCISAQPKPNKAEEEKTS